MPSLVRIKAYKKIGVISVKRDVADPDLLVPRQRAGWVQKQMISIQRRTLEVGQLGCRVSRRARRGPSVGRAANSGETGGSNAVQERPIR